MFSGYTISIEVSGQTICERSVIPAILDEAVAALVAAFQAQDPHDNYKINVQFCSNAFAEVWSKT